MDEGGNGAQGYWDFTKEELTKTLNMTNCKYAKVEVWFILAIGNYKWLKVKGLKKIKG